MKGEAVEERVRKKVGKLCTFPLPQSLAFLNLLSYLDFQLT